MKDEYIRLFVNTLPASALQGSEVFIVITQITWSVIHVLIGLSEIIFQNNYLSCLQFITTFLL